MKLVRPACLAQSLETLPDWLVVASKQSDFIQANWLGQVKVVGDVNLDVMDVSWSLGDPVLVRGASSDFPTLV